MSLEFWNTVAAFGTFVVIFATAIAALIQLRHLRSANQIASFTRLLQDWESREMVEAWNFVHNELPGLLEDPSFRHELDRRLPPASEKSRLARDYFRRVGNFFEYMGWVVEMGFIDRQNVMRYWAVHILDVWHDLEPCIGIIRRSDSGVFDRFEYLYVLAREWHKDHPKGTFPKTVPRVDLVDKYREADRLFASAPSPTTDIAVRGDQGSLPR